MSTLLTDHIVSAKAIMLSAEREAAIMTERAQCYRQFINALKAIQQDQEETSPVTANVTAR